MLSIPFWSTDWAQFSFWQRGAVGRTHPALSRRPNSYALGRITMGSFLDGPLFESEFPPRELRPGALVRVRLAGEGDMIEGVLQGVDRRGLRVEEPERLKPTFRGAVANGLFIEEEEAPSKRVHGVAWNQIEMVQVRARAATAGLIWGLVLSLGLGWCGNGLDHLTGGSPKAELVNIGIGIGVLIGVLVARFGRQWRAVWKAKVPEAP